MCDCLMKTFETCSIASGSSSTREESDALWEENRLLYDAMEDQTRVQQDVLARLVGDMADH